MNLFATNALWGRLSLDELPHDMITAGGAVLASARARKCSR